MPSRKEEVFGTPAPVALVTGSAKRGRIGNHIAHLLAQHGYRVIVHANTSRKDAETTVKQLQKCGVDATILQANFNEPDSAEQLAEQAHAWQGRLDVLVHAAAIWEPRRLEDVTADDLERHWRINTQANFIVSRSLGLRMAAQEMGGVIINLGDWAVQRPYVDHTAYFSTKAGVSVMTRTLAIELGRRNPRVRVNAVLPGVVTLSPEAASELRETAIQETLARREGTPQHVAEAVVALIENDYITGVSLPVDGGRSIYAGGEGEWRKGLYS